MRTPSNTGRVVVINAVTTWQVYNQWGGYSLYARPGRVPRDAAHGRCRSTAPTNRRCLGPGSSCSSSRPRCWSRSTPGSRWATPPTWTCTPTRTCSTAPAPCSPSATTSTGRAPCATAATAARDRGVNLAFLGGNEVYRHIRLAPTRLGANRLEIDYKSFSEDPTSRTDPPEATPDWRQPPYPRPESVLTGNYYSCFPGWADLVDADPDNWLLQGLVGDGEKLTGVVGIEYAKVNLSVPTPRPIEVLFHSPVLCGTTHQREFSDAVYYTTPSGAGVFSTGTQGWVCGLDPGLPRQPRATRGSPGR